MHIRKIEIENVRGITHWKEEFGKENVRILGPNGSGKSSVIQSVEFVLTGDISRLRGSGTQGIPFPEYASHMEAEPDEAWVEGTFAHEGEQDVTVKRLVSEPTNPEVVEPEGLNEIPDWLDEQMEAAALGHSILDRDRLLRFVTAPEGERGDRIDELFGLEKMDEKRKALKYAERKHRKEEIKTLKKEKSQADQRFFELFEQGVSTRSGALERVNELREEHGAKGLDSLDEDFTEGIELGEVISVDSLQSEPTVSLLEQVADQFDGQQSQFQGHYDQLQELTSELKAAEHLERELATLELVENGLSVFDHYDNECPLCLTDWEDEHLLERLDERREQAANLKDRKEALESLYKEVNELIVGYTDSLESLRSELREDYPKAAARISEEIVRAESCKSELNNGPLTDLVNEPDVHDLVFTDDIESEIHRLLEIAEEKPELKSTTKNVDRLARADDRYEELVERERELEEAEEVQDVLGTIKQHFLDARSRVLTDAFGDIRKKFEKYYEEMHQDDEAEDFSAILEPTDTGVKFEPKFYDRGHHHPSAVHSEGHRDSMGLALFLAMSDVGGEAIDILLLDDVMMSIDSGHRSNIANLLAGDISDRYQILLTTHDKTWDRHLHLTGEFQKQVRFSKCSLGGGPLPVENISDPWERIEYLIERDDVTSAAAWIRKTVEWYSRRSCAALKASVPYHELEDESLQIGRLFTTALSEYQSLLEGGTVVEQTDYPQSLYDQTQIDANLEAIEKFKQDMERHLNLLHRNVHHNDAEAAFYTGEELKSERDVFRRAYDLLYCEDCGSWVKRGEYVYCNCTIRVDP
ncbi:AAA family ATPase [Haloarchaeobius baliensis]|uniref:AAA family ATPase n=1 Tax=Haloarchaeobius baliensis TaxID=1670458 RepID=UPI003F885E40